MNPVTSAGLSSLMHKKSRKIAAFFMYGGQLSLGLTS